MFQPWTTSSIQPLTTHQNAPSILTFVAKAGSDADKAAAKATKAKPAEKATLEANANNLKELFDSVSRMNSGYVQGPR